MVANKNDQPVSALKKWALILSCLAVGLLLGLFISGSARNDLDRAREWSAAGDLYPVIENKPVKITPPPYNFSCTCQKESR